jgi:hypothetical protein
MQNLIWGCSKKSRYDSHNGIVTGGYGAAEESEREYCIFDPDQILPICVVELTNINFLRKSQSV